MPIVNYLHTIVASGYWKEEEWQLWADNLILCNDELEDWVYEVAFAKNKEELCLAIAYNQNIEVFNEKTLYWEPDVIIGYYYLMYQEGRMNLSELFLKLVDEDDISSESKLFDSQEVIDVLNMAKKGENDIIKLDELLKPLAKVASGQLAEVIHYMDV